ncbi:MAG: hypothetical protein ABEK36_05370 [Candidatus Aenigmatarchaeota archaeon]
MLLKKAYEMAKGKGDIRSLVDSGGYLCSAYVFLTPEDEEIDNWELGFHVHKENKIVPVSVDGEVEITEGDEPLKEEVHQIAVEDIDFNAEEALEKAKKVQKNNFGRKVQKILLSIKKDEKLFWNVAFITGSFSIVTVKVNTEDGEILETNEKTLMQNMGSDKKLSI